MNAGAGNDWVYVSSAESVNVNLDEIQAENVVGHDGDDTFTKAGPEDVFIYGGAGNDTIRGGSGLDVLEGGEGADTLDGGQGRDILSYESSTEGVFVNLEAKTASGGDAEGDTFENFNGVVGSVRGDNFKGDDEFNVFFGNGGNDLIEGGAGGDYIDGGQGTDTASYAGSNVAVTVDLEPTVDGDQIYVKEASGGHAQYDRLVSIENLVGSAHSDTLRGNAEANVLEGDAGADTLDGREGEDTLSYAGSDAAVIVDLESQSVSGGHAQGDSVSNFEHVDGSTHDDTLSAREAGSYLFGDAGADTLTGRSGDDTLQGGSGADTITGGAGTDTLSYENSAEAVTVDLGAGTASGGDAEGDSFSGVENLQGSYHDDTLTGDAGDNVLEGDLGADTLDGSDGTDTASYEDALYGVDVSLKRGGGRRYADLSVTGYDDAARRYGDVIPDTDPDYTGRVVHSGSDLSVAYVSAEPLSAGWMTAGFAVDLGGNGDAQAGLLLGETVDLSTGEIRPQSGAYMDVELQDERIAIRFYRQDGSLEASYTNVISDANEQDFAVAYDRESGIVALFVNGDVARSYQWKEGLDLNIGSYGSNGAEVTVGAIGPSYALALGLITDEAVNDVLTNIENLRGSDNGDILTGDDQDNVLEGLAGNDRLEGGEGADVLIGGAGDDVLIGDEGDRYEYSLGDGHDRIQHTGGVATLALGEGISAESVNLSIDRDDLVLNFENSVFFTNKIITEGVSTTQSNLFLLDNGNYILAWDSAHEGGARDVFVQLFDGNGQELGDVVKLDKPGSGRADSPEILRAEDGSLSVLWKYYDGHGKSANGQYEQKIDELTQKLGGYSKVVENPEKIYLSNGDYILTYRYKEDFPDGGYVEFRQGSYFERIFGPNVIEGYLGKGSVRGYIQLYDETGEKRGEEIDVGLGGSGGLTVMSDGSFVASWASDGKTRFQKFSADGSLVGKEREFSNINDYSGLDIFETNDGGFFVTWVSSGSLKRMKYNSNAELVGGVKELADIFLPNSFHYKADNYFSVEMDRDENFLISYLDDENNLKVEKIASDTSGSVRIEGYFDDGDQPSIELFNGVVLEVPNLSPELNFELKQSANEYGEILITREDLLSNVSDEKPDLLSVDNLIVSGLQASLIKVDDDQWVIQLAADTHGELFLSFDVSDGRI